MITELQQLGFTRNEANVYYCALKLGTCSVQELATATGLNRITVHSIVEKFERLQIFTRLYEGKRRRISAVAPSRLELLLQEEEQELKNKKRTYEEILPSLEKMFGMTKRGTQISTFTGEKGYEQICEDVLHTNTEMWEYANIDDLNKVIGPYIAADYLPKKHKQKIKTKFLLVDSPSARKYIDSNYMTHVDPAPMQAKFIDPKEFQLDAFYVIYGDKLAILTPSTMDGVIIQDKAISNSLRPFFKFVWDRAGTEITNTKSTQGGEALK